jgi:hypothetical protein
MADPIDITPFLRRRRRAEVDETTEALKEHMSEWLKALDHNEIHTAYLLLLPLLHSVAREEQEKLDQDPEPPQAS